MLFFRTAAEIMTCLNDVANQFCENRAKKLMSDIWKASVRDTDFSSLGPQYKECREMAETAERLG